MTTPNTNPEQTQEQTAVAEEGNLLKNILGLIEPEQKDVRPPVEEKPATEKPVEESKSTEEKPAEEPKPAKKATVRRREPTKPQVVLSPPTPVSEEKIEEVVKRTIAAQPKPEAPKEETPKPELRPEQQEEYEIAQYLEKKDPTKKGVSAKLLAYYNAEKAFLEKRVAEEGDDYDPSTDPEYRKFLTKNAPPMSAAERKAAVTQRITEEAETRAAERVRQEMTPVLDQTQRKLREMEEKPKIQKRINEYLDEVASGMPEEVVKFYTESGGDMAKTREAFPMEFDIVERTVRGALTVADEFLHIRSGLKDLDVKGNPKHQYIHDFVKERAEVFLERGGPALTRGNKSFVHPFKWKAGMEQTHWTFDDNDILSMLKVRAQQDARAQIARENKRVETLLTARQRRTTAPKSAVEEKEPEGSPKIGSAPAPGVADTSVSETGLLSSILGYAPKSAQ